MHRVKQKLKMAWERVRFTLKNRQNKPKKEIEIYKKSFLEAIIKEIEEKKI